ncbi:galactokinase [Pseudoneobacillus sp. C159]
MDFELLRSIFRDKFQQEANRYFFAPGRINLIGEHTDYNGGNSFPCAITFGTYAIVRKRNDHLIRMFSMNFPEKEIIAFEINDLSYDKNHDWANYPKGMIHFIKEAGYPINLGLDVLYYGTIPNRAGLSSSASIELVTGVLLERMFDLKIERLDMIKTGQKVENDFIGVNSGIMDQFAIGMGKEGHGILLDSQTLNYEYAPLDLTQHSILIMNTNKHRVLAESKYNERRSECEEALLKLQETLNIQSLGDLTVEEFEQNKHQIQDETIRKRAKHAVYENRRTLTALTALKNGDLKKFGQLMNQSHISLRDDYEVTGKELDTLVEASWEQKGLIGARMTGAGFGGCAIAIVENGEIDNIMLAVGNRYKAAIGYPATLYVANIGGAAKEITLEVKA